jgi:hypothetical protein
VWHELQLRNQLADRRGSKKSILPSSIFSGVSGLPGNWGGSVGIGSNIPLARSSRSAPG